MEPCPKYVAGCICQCSYPWEPHWARCNICSPITEVKQLWAWLALGWVIIWDTLVAAKDVIDTCHVPLWLMSYKHTKRFPECSQMCKKGWGVCCHAYVTGAYKRMCVVHQNMPNHHTSICHECANECCIESQTKRGTVPYEMVGLYAPQGVALGGGGSHSWKVEWHSMESGLSRKNCKVTFENLQKLDSKCTI